MIQGTHDPKRVIPDAVYFYVRYGVSYRDLEEIMEERGVGVGVDHGTLNRWVVKLAPLVSAQAQSRKTSTAKSWRRDETDRTLRRGWRKVTTRALE